MKCALLMATTILFLAACQNQPQPARTVVPLQPSPRSSPEYAPSTDGGQSVVDCINRIAFLETGEKKGMLKAWKSHPGYNRFRMVEPPDFRIPEWVSREQYASDIERAVGRSHDYGELGGAYGVVLFIVDKTIIDPNRFSLAVLIRRPGNRFSLYWVFEKRDLSRVTLHRHSGDAYLREHRDDGTTRSCDIQWSRKLQRWACELD